MCDSHNTELTINADSTVADRRRFVQMLAAGGALSLAAGCATNPVTGERQLSGFVGSGQLDQIAAASWAETTRSLPQVQDPRYLNRLRSIGGRIQRVASGVGDNWEYAVFDDDQRNAFVLPGGRVGFYKGMMDFAQNEDQIACVLGHEVGHVAGKHAEERANQQVAGQFGTAILGGILTRGAGNPQQTQGLVQAIGLGYQLGVVLPYSRGHERQADLLGVNYMHRSGYDVNQSVRLWERMAAASQGQQRPSEFSSTHPDPNDRARYLANYIEEQRALGSQGFQDQSVSDFDYEA